MGSGAAWGDYDGDGWADYRGAMGLATGDWDNDGDLDIFITHWIAQESALYVNLLAESAASLPAESAAIPAAPGATAGTLPPAAPASPPTPGGTADAAAGAADAAAGAPDLRFSDMADRYGVGAIALDFVGWGTAFFDYDNDGRLDLLVANGSTFQDPDHPEALVPMRQQLFWNRDDEDGFFEVSSVSGDVFQAQSVGRGAAVADYDNDGDVDAFIVNHGAAPILLRNDGGNARHWLKVRLRGARNRFGIGARLALTADGARQIREVGSGSSYLSQNDVEAAFGLGDAVSVTTLQVRWPGGAVEELAVIPADQTIEVTEGHGWRTIALAGGAAAGGAAAQPAGGGAPIPPASAAAGADPIGSPAPLSRAEQLRFWELQREAMQLMKTESDWRAAADRFREALALNPDHEDALYYLGSCLVEIEDYGAALAQYEHLVAVNPQSLRGFLQIGALHALPEAGELYDLAAAEQGFRAALAINPEESGSLLQLGATALARGDLDGASDDLRNARRLNPKAAEAFYLDGYIHWIRGDREGATTLLAQAIEIAQAQHPTAPAPSEGDTRRAGQQAMMLANAQSRRLFGAPVAALAQHPPGEAVTAATAAAAYQQIEAYLAGLPKRQ